MVLRLFSSGAFSYTLALAALLLIHDANIAANASVPKVEPLDQALSEILPSQYQVNYGPDVDRKSPVLVSLSHHAGWRSRLDSAMAGTGMAWSRNGDEIDITSFTAGTGANADVNSTGTTAIVTQTTVVSPEPPAAMISAPANGFLMVPYNPPAPPSPPAAPPQVDADNGLQITPYAPQSEIKPTPVLVVPVSPPVTTAQLPLPPPVAPGIPGAPVQMPVHSVPLIAVVPVLPPPPPVQQWLLPKDTIVADDLQDWAKQSGWHLVWELPQSPVVPMDASVSGDFQGVVSIVVRALHDQGVDIKARFYDYAGANTVVITTQGTPDNAVLNANTLSGQSFGQ